MGKKSAPKAPDPVKTAGAQTAQNIGTATANSYLNNVNQIGPDGNVMYSVDGFTSYTDPLDGKVYQIPKWTQTTTLSPHEQQLKNIGNQTEINLAQLGADQSGKLQTLLGSPVDLSNDAVEGRLFDLGRKRLDPMFAEREDALRTRLINSGIREGTDAYNSEYRRFSEGQNDAYNNLLLSGRGQAVQERLQERNQPINEITALMSGSQVALPTFGAGTQQYNIPTTDYAGIVSDAYKNKLAAWQNNQASMGGLFSLVGSGIAAFSDERLKENVEKVGKTDDGQKIYTWNYKGDDRPQMGLIAQEVAKRKPEAVKRHPSGFMMVDYGKALANRKAA